MDHAISGSAMSRRPHFIRCYMTAMVQRLNAHEVARDEVELAPRLELRLRRRVALDLREGVEGAPLGPGARPGLAHGLGEPAPAVGDDHVGRRDRRHEGRPRPRVLRPRHVPGDRPLAAAAYEHHELARDPDPVDVGHAVELAVGDGHRPDLRDSAVLRLKDRPPPGIMACESFERSHPRNFSSLDAVSSYLSVVDAPQAVRLQRWDPDEVLPLRLVRPPQ